METLPVVVLIEEQNVNGLRTRFRDPKENRWWVPRATMGYRVPQVLRATADRVRSAPQDLRGLQDLLGRPRDTAQVLFLSLLCLSHRKLRSLRVHLPVETDTFLSATALTISGPSGPAGPAGPAGPPGPPGPAGTAASVCETPL